MVEREGVEGARALAADGDGLDEGDAVVGGRGDAVVDELPVMDAPFICGCT
jgi:hypothetical protein